MAFDLNVFNRNSDEIKKNLTRLTSIYQPELNKYFNDWDAKAKKYIDDIKANPGPVDPNVMEVPLLNEQLEALLYVSEFLVHLSRKSPKRDESDLWLTIQVQLLLMRDSLTQGEVKSRAQKIITLLKPYHDIVIIKKNRPSLTPEQILADQELAREFFKTHPGERFCGMSQGIKFSYFKSTNGEIFRRTEELGKGAFGRTKLAVNIETDEKIALKRQKTPIDLTSLQKEAAINLDLGVAVTPLEIRIKDGSTYKVYQGMKNLGRPMDKYLENEGLSAPLEKRLEYSIQLLLRVHELHTGAASKLRKPYAHCDIKPANICLDEAGQIHLIDFGLTRDSNLDAKHTAASGTRGYLPRNIVVGTVWWSILNYCVETPSYFFDDKIAVLRSIFHPESTMLNGFLTKAQFDSLPPFIKDVLMSDDINKCIRENYSLVSIAAVLAYYQLNPRCTQAQVAEILASSEISERLIAKFQSYTPEEKAHILDLMQKIPLAYNDLLRDDFKDQLPLMLEIERKLKAGEDVASFLRSNTLSPYFVYKLIPFAVIPEAYTDENFGKAFLQDGQSTIDIDALSEAKKLVIVKAFNDASEPINKDKVMFLREKGIIKDEQIRLKPQFKYDLEISPLEGNIEYWRGILTQAGTSTAVLLQVLKHAPAHEWIQLIIENHVLNTDLIQEILNNPSLSPSIISELIEKVFVPDGNTDTQSRLLEHILAKKITLNDSEYEKITKLDSKINWIKNLVLKAACNSPGRFEFLYQTKLLSNIGYLEIFEKNNDIGWINQLMTKELWVTYLKDDSIVFAIDFKSLNEAQIQFLSQAFNETLGLLNKEKVKLLMQKGIINLEQIRLKPQFKYDLEISPLEENIEYWRGILTQAETPPAVLLQVLQHKPDVDDELIQLIIENYRLNTDLVKEILKKPGLRPSIISQLIEKVVVADGDIKTQLELLEHILYKSIILNDSEYKNIANNTMLGYEIDQIKKSILKNECNSQDRFEFLYQTKLLTNVGYLLILELKNDIGWINQFMIKELWVTYLKYDSIVFAIDFASLKEAQKQLLSQAFNESRTIIKDKVKLLREKGIINDEQIRSKPQFKYDLEISPPGENIEYWRGILTQAETPVAILSQVLQHAPAVADELIQSIIKNPQFNLFLFQKIIQKPVLSPSIISELIEKVFVADGDTLSQSELLNYIKDKKIKLTEDEYEKILQLNSSLDMTKALVLKDACDSPRKFILLNQKKLLSPKGYLEILKNKDIGWIKAFMTKELWVAYLKQNTPPFDIDFTQLDATQKALISRAVIEANVQEQPIYIAKLKEYGIEILRVTEEGSILFKTLDAQPQVSDEYLQAIIQNPIFNLNRLKIMCSFKQLSSNIISELISKFFSAGGNNDSQSYLLNVLKNKKVSLTDEQFEIISSNFKIQYSESNKELFTYFATQCNTVDRLKLFYKNESKYPDKLNFLEEKIFLRYFLSNEDKLKLIQDADIGEKVAVFLLKNQFGRAIDIINEIINAHPNIKDDVLFELLLRNITKEKLSANFGVFLANCINVERLPELISKLRQFELKNDFLKFVMNKLDISHFEVLSHTLGALSYKELKSAASLLPKDEQWIKLFEKADNLNKAKHVDAAKDILCILFKMDYQQKCNNLNDETFKLIMAPHTAIQQQRGFKYIWDIIVGLFRKKPESLGKQSFFKTKSEEMVESLKENIAPTPKTK